MKQMISQVFLVVQNYGFNGNICISEAIKSAEPSLTRLLSLKLPRLIGILDWDNQNDSQRPIWISDFRVPVFLQHLLSFVPDALDSMS